MKISFAVLVCFSAIVTGVISTSLWGGKITGIIQKSFIKNPGLLVIRQNEKKKKPTFKSPKKGLASLVSELYALTAAFCIKEYENQPGFGGLFVTRAQSTRIIDIMISHNQYNPENQYEYDIGIIKEVFLSVLRDNRHNRRTDKSIYVKPMQKGGNETFDNSDIGGPVLKFNKLIGVISKYSPAPGSQACTLIGPHLMKNFVDQALPNEVLPGAVLLEKLPENALPNFSHQTP